MRDESDEVKCRGETVHLMRAEIVIMTSGYLVTLVDAFIDVLGLRLDSIETHFRLTSASCRSLGKRMALGSKQSSQVSFFFP